MFYDKMCRMVFGVVSFLFFTFIASNISAFRNVFFLFGGYLFIYFTIFFLSSACLLRIFFHFINLTIKRFIGSLLNISWKISMMWFMLTRLYLMLASL
ncbi:hypothetical protein EOV50_07655 [Salmonella enterica subsp. enterica serovar Mokola]|nr:hypothetical protein [Salmonella enterica subsp. enterica serovar Enteritidis]ECA6748091.1 hypothetical protein [Salmonella enterica subsp. enterica serovar Mokola]ECG2647849.1 hypothetical protein [Salmonella enterica subsp. enterica serovar Chailey]EBU6660344.1 hypothetical protein [Salmonella enterica subsp. enterica serovar Enteritidis]EBV1258517.1 hypothetical protein [Salmonella enterica subsp. enterica serovar Enteritidis]